MPSMMLWTRALVDALVAAVDEHGAPNAFYLAELHREYGGPPPSVTTYLFRGFTTRCRLFTWLCVGTHKDWTGLKLERRGAPPRMVLVVGELEPIKEGP